MSKKIYFIIILLVLVLSGCEKQSKERNLIRHPEKFKAILVQCDKMPYYLAMQDKKCQFAINLFKKIISFGDHVMVDPQDFGNKILSLQMERAKVKEQIEKQNNQLQKDGLEKLYDKYDELDKQIDIMLSLVSSTM